MVNPWRIIGWWFIWGIVASPVFLGVWWFADKTKAALEELERIERERHKRINALAMRHERLVSEALQIHYNAGGGRCG